jgi:hypothetical protein
MPPVELSHVVQPRPYVLALLVERVSREQVRLIIFSPLIT